MIIKLYTSLLLIVSSFFLKAQIGLNNPNPIANLDLNGDLALRMEELNLTSSNNEKLPVTLSSFYKLTATSINNDITVEGIDYPANGKIISLLNGSLQKITFVHASPNTTNNRQIILANGVSVSILPNEIIILAYDPVFEKWRVMASDLKINSGWLLNGITAINNQTIGTNNYTDLVIKTNNYEALRIEADGDVKIGNPNYYEYSTKLQVNGSTEIIDKPIIVSQDGVEPKALIISENDIQSVNITPTGNEATNLFLNNSGGSVGVNLPVGTTPKASLDVRGNGIISANLVADKNLTLNYGNAYINKDIKNLSGTITTPFTGNANMLPIAYGEISNGSDLQSKNYKVEFNRETGAYAIDVPGYEIDLLLLSSNIMFERKSLGGGVYTNDYLTPTKLRFYYTEGNIIKYFNLKPGLQYELPSNVIDGFFPTLAFVAFGHKL